MTSLAATLASALLIACGGGSDAAPPSPASPPAPAAAFTLQVLHVADMDSGGDLVTNSKGLSALVNTFRTAYPSNTVFLSSGDNFIPGPFFNASDDASLAPELGAAGAGRGDIEILNLMGLQASAVGNHDLDLGPNFFNALINAGGGWRGAQFPYLSANLDFGTDSNLNARVVADGGDAATQVNRLSGTTVITVNGERIGILGATTPTLASITSTGNITVRPAGTDIDALAAEIQPKVDALTATGIDKVILLAHMQQISVEQALATRLRGVDLIVAGGSNTRLFDADDRIRPGDTSQGTYPLRYTSPTSEPVLVVNVDADYKYLGRIVLPFDGAGRIIPARLDAALNGAWATDSDGLSRAGTSLANATAGVVTIADKIAAVIAAKDGNLFGAASVYLEGDRSFVRNEETNLGHLSAQANLRYARTNGEPSTAVSLKNGGGIRASIGAFDIAPGATSGTKGPARANAGVGKQAGDISQLDIEFALRFNNGLSVLSVTAEELKALLEHGVAALGNQGRFPQVAGMRFSYDPAQPAGSRVRTLVVDDPDGSGPTNTPEVVYSAGALAVAPGTAYRLVTLGFLADGGDGYPFAGLSAPNRVNLLVGSGFTAPGSEQKALADFLIATHPRATPYDEADTPAAQDARIQNLSLRAEALP